MVRSNFLLGYTNETFLNDLTPHICVAKVLSTNFFLEYIKPGNSLQAQVFGRDHNVCMLLRL